MRLFEYFVVENGKEIREIERNINDHTRMLCKLLNAGENHDHIERIINSKVGESEATAPKYFLYKDHEKEESWRPVVSGCMSNTLGLSNMLSEVCLLYTSDAADE